MSRLKKEILGKLKEYAGKMGKDHLGGDDIESPRRGGLRDFDGYDNVDYNKDMPMDENRFAKKPEVTPKQLSQIQADIKKINRKIKVYISKHPVDKGKLSIELGHGHDNDSEIDKIYKVLKKRTGDWRTGTMFNESVNEAYIVLYSPKKGVKPVATAAYRDKKDAQKWEKDLKREKGGGITMLVQKKMKGIDEDKLKEACWKGYKAVGGKIKNGKQVPNCVPESVNEELSQSEIEKLKKIEKELKNASDIHKAQSDALAKGSKMHSAQADRISKLYEKLHNKLGDESVNEAKVETERYFGKKGIIIMIRDGNKMISAIFKDKKNADKFNRNKPADVKKLVQLAKKTKYPKAIDETVNEGPIDRVIGGRRYKYVGDGRKGKAIVSGPIKDKDKNDIIKRAKKAGYLAKPNMGGGVTIFIESVNEGMFSTIDQIRQDSKNVRDFVKNVFKDREFKKMSNDKDFIKYLKSIYEGIDESKGVPSNYMSGRTSDYHTALKGKNRDYSGGTNFKKKNHGQPDVEEDDEDQETNHLSNKQTHIKSPLKVSETGKKKSEKNYKDWKSTNEGFDKVEHLSLLNQALRAIPGSQKQKDIIRKLNVIRKAGGMRPLKELSIVEYGQRLDLSFIEDEEAKLDGTYPSTDAIDRDIDETAKRDYKDEYKKFQSSKKSKKYRAELNKYNRQKGTYGNGDGKDASHKGGKIVGFESASKNRGRAEKSRLKKENVAPNHNDKSAPYGSGYKKVNEIGVFPVSNYIKGIIPQGYLDTNTPEKKKQSVKLVGNLKKTLNTFWKQNNIPFKIK